MNSDKAADNNLESIVVAKLCKVEANLVHEHCKSIKGTKEQEELKR